MAEEIEYRFLLPSLPGLHGVSPKPITQGYLSTDPERTVRIRRIGDDAKITVKGARDGATGLEFEYDIPVDDAVAMLKLCGDNVLDKDRYMVPVDGNLVWEIDCFKGRLEGLVIAELEVPSLKTAFGKPHWLKGVDITSDFRFANAALTQTSREEVLENIEKVLRPL